MNKCDCYFAEEAYEAYRPSNFFNNFLYYHPETLGRCNGTKERDVCSCKGDRTKCDFYPEVREKALKKQEDSKTCSLCRNDKKFKINSISIMNCTSSYATFDLGRIEDIRFCPRCGRQL